MSITVHDAFPVKSNDIALAEVLYIDYFSDLYTNISSAVLGINGEVNEYLCKIFQKTEQALLSGELSLAFAHCDNRVVGCMTYQPLDIAHITLIRTMPAHLSYKHRELEIRSAMVQYLVQKPNVQKVVVMVRTANKVHQELCIQAGFKAYGAIREQSIILKTEYSSQYLVYIFE